MKSNPSQEALSFGNSRKPYKAFEGKDMNIDNKKFTPEERERIAQRQQKKRTLTGQQIKTNKKAIEKEGLRTKLGRLEERIEGAAEVTSIFYISLFVFFHFQIKI